MTRRAAALLLVVFASCSTPAPPPKPAPAPPPAPPQLVINGTAKKVVLVSFDGLGSDIERRFGAPAFERMPAHVARVIPVTPTATSSTHAAILSGATPDRTGIVSNQFHRPGTPRSETAKGLETEIGVDTIVDVARRAGKRVGAIAFPFIDWASPRRSAGFGIAWTMPSTRPRVIQLTRADFHTEWLPPSWGSPAPRHASFSPVMRARIDWNVPAVAREDVDLVAYDTTNDHVENYDTFFVEAGGKETPLDAKRWFAVSMQTKDGLYGSWSKILRADPSLASITIYWGAISHTRGDASFVAEVDERIGFWPGAADEVSVRDKSIDDATFAEQNDRLADFLTGVAHYAMTSRDFDLLLVYEPIVDAAQHQFLAWRTGTPACPRCAEQAGVPVLHAAFNAFDRGVASMTRDAFAIGATILITGDHGLAPVDTEVHLGRILADWNEPQWSAFANGNIVHFNRFDDPDDTAALMAKLTALRSPDGAAVFERVEPRSAASHPNSGDIIAYSAPRFALSAAQGDAFVVPLYHGQHGGLSSHPEFHTMLGAEGPAIPPQTIEAMPQTGIAPLIERLLGLSAASSGGG
jgi:predicted AlkP superfamily pyrophosphatase or phosphodiesterase